MNVRKLLDWRKLLIYSHRWLGIAVGVVFILWCVSGFVLMYYGIPTLKAGERLMRMPALDLTTVHVTPAEVVRQLKLKEPARLRISMQGDRPAYRINTGRGFGAWTVVYADTGEKMQPMDAGVAMEWMRRFRPDHAASLRYDAYLTAPDHFVRIPAMQGLLPFHRIALDDAAGTKYYVSEKTGEAVVRTDRLGRLLGFTGYTLHRFFWWRHRSWYTSFLYWISWVGIVMSLTGLVVGIWRYGLTPRFRHKGVYSHSPYKGWMKWHHYAGLIFGLVTFTWMVSGAVDVPAIPSITNVAAPYQSGFTPAQLKQGARSNQGTGGPIDLEPLTIESIRKSAEAIASTLPPKELELLQIGSKPYFIAYRAPSSESELDNWKVQSGLDFLAPNLDQEHVLVSALEPQRGTFTNFERETMFEIAKAAMPGIRVRDAVWLDAYDDYYYQSVASFNVGLMKHVATLPVLRVRFDDPRQTWLYMTPSHGQMVKATAEDRVVRWSLYGLHALDFAFLYSRRPLWDISVVLLLAGSTLLSCTTLVPAYRRLKRHARAAVTPSAAREQKRLIPSS
jgi:PepSY-associated TM region